MYTDELKQTVGAENLLTLSQALGGKFVYVPKAPSSENILATVLNERAQQALSDYAGGSVVYIPTTPARKERYRIIRKMTPDYSARQIARALGVSPRTVRHVRRQHAIDQQLAQRAEHHERAG